MQSETTTNPISEAINKLPREISPPSPTATVRFIGNGPELQTPECQTRCMPGMLNAKQG